MNDAENKHPWIERPNDPNHVTGSEIAADSNAATDPEATALTQTWAAFSRLLKKSQPPLDEPALVAAVLSRVARRERRRRRLRLGAVGLAMAATLLVAVSLAWFPRGGAEVAVAPQDGAAQHGAPENGGPKHGGHVAAVPKVDPMLAWDDRELSDSLAAAQREASRLEISWRQTTDALTSFQNRVDALQQEMENSSL